MVQKTLFDLTYTFLDFCELYESVYPLSGTPTAGTVRTVVFTRRVLYQFLKPNKQTTGNVERGFASLRHDGPFDAQHRILHPHDVPFFDVHIIPASVLEISDLNRAFTTVDARRVGSQIRSILVLWQTRRLPVGACGLGI